MKAEIISIGTELLLGEIVDTNSAHIARQLREIGLDLYFATTVGDNETRISSAISIALDRADIVITTGGLGPTVDDVTRQAVATATNRQLVFQQALLDQIAQRFQRFGSKMSENNHQQAYIPDGAIPIENPVGTAPCFIVESERGVVISLPGVPREMTYLLDATVIPYLRQRFNLSSIIKARILRTAGIGESHIDQAIIDLMKLTNPTVGLAAHIGQTDIRITAKATDADTANRMIEDIEKEVRRRLGAFIYGIEKDRIEVALVQELKRNNQTIAIAEAGSGSMLYDRLTKANCVPPVLAAAEQHESLQALTTAIGVDPTANIDVIGTAALEHLSAKAQAAINLVLIVEPDITFIGIKTPSETKTRVYHLGDEGTRPLIFGSTWGIALAWRWLRDQPQAD